MPERRRHDRLPSLEQQVDLAEERYQAALDYVVDLERMLDKAEAALQEAEHDFIELRQRLEDLDS